MLDLRLVATDTRQSGLKAGLDKTRFDQGGGGLRLGGGFLKLEGDLTHSIGATVIVSAQDDRVGLLDINEAWLEWRPVPSSAWKSQVRVGAFFPASSLEFDYGSISWTPRDTISSSAVNSWIGEELRTVGFEYKLSRNGKQAGSAHSYGLTAGVFAANDPAGSLIAWRGWSVSDRITGLRESIPLANLPVFLPGGGLPNQSRAVNAFRELDQRLGVYGAAHYANAQGFEATVMRYDNRADPMVLKSGQYAWLTRFNHLSAKVTGVGGWDFTVQSLQGDTLMGPSAVYLDFSAWYLLATRPLGPGTIALRVDSFNTTERREDILPGDPNGETGQALALAYHWRIKPGVALVTEWLTVQSDRPARALLGGPLSRTESSLSTSLRLTF